MQICIERSPSGLTGSQTSSDNSAWYVWDCFWLWVRQHELAMSQTTRVGHESDNTSWPWVRQHEWPWVRQHEVAMSRTTRGGHESDNTSGRQLAAGWTSHRTVPPVSKVPPLATTAWRVSRSLCLYAAGYKRLKLYNQCIFFIKPNSLTRVKLIAQKQLDKNYIYIHFNKHNLTKNTLTYISTNRTLYNNVIQ